LGDPMPSTPTQSEPTKLGRVAGASPASATVDLDLILYALVAANAAETKRRKKRRK
jgi:hypothetical protein